MSLNRRSFLAGTAAATATLAAPMVRAQAAEKIVVLGGGIGGATAAKYIRILNPQADVTVIEKDRTYYTCPRSNDVLTGVMDIDTITFTLDTLVDRYGIKTVYNEVIGADFDARIVRLKDGSSVPYDRLVVSPGVDLMFEEIWGLTPEATETTMLHGWKAGEQTLKLREQFLNLRQGGTVIIAAPPNPYRCPPGPYERASMMAEHLQHHNPTAKIIILDPKNEFTKGTLFRKGWERLYGFGTDKALIEWVPEEQGGYPTAVNPDTLEVQTAAGVFKGDMVNVIPPMQAGKLAKILGLTNREGWCPVNQTTFASDLAPNVHVIGDACVAGAMPKSGYAANSQAKTLAAVIKAQANGAPTPVPTYANACYSLVSENYGISIASIYEVNEDGVIHAVSGGISPIDELPNRPVLEAVYQKNWHRTFAADVFS